MHGVYTFLEGHLECRWFHPKMSRIPKRQRVEVEAIHDTQIASITKVCITVLTTADLMPHV